MTFPEMMLECDIQGSYIIPKKAIHRKDVQWQIASLAFSYIFTLIVPDRFVTFLFQTTIDQRCSSCILHRLKERGAQNFISIASDDQDSRV